jgi:hypothetical protein
MLHYLCKITVLLYTLCVSLFNHLKNAKELLHLLLTFINKIILFIIISITNVILFLFLNLLIFVETHLQEIIEYRLAIIHNFIWIFKIFIIAKISSQTLVK